ncbi:MAG: VOC family protein [Gammaproteobacteria bacterium]|nr:VOC family protein [Gammaproteobacteria bacterium]
MKIHHVCLVVKNIDESLKLYRDLLGFMPYLDMVIPNPKAGFFDQQTLDDIFHVKGAKSRMVMSKSKEGTMLEMQQPTVPAVQNVPKEQLQYGFTGFHELAFTVDDIDEWYTKIKAAGYEMQTAYTWSVGGVVKSFLFYDVDGNMVQMIEEIKQVAK